MKRSDKENNGFDEMMKNAFDGFEMEPSKTVWSNIENKLDEKKKSAFGTRMARLSIAASVIICMVVGATQLNVFNNGNADQAIIAGNKNTADTTSENSSDKKNEKKSDTMQPVIEDQRLADVVEIKSTTPRSLKNNKKTPVNNSKPKKADRPLEEKQAIELLKKMEEEVETKKIPTSDPEQKKPAVVKPLNPSIAMEGSKKKEIDGVVDVLNYVASKVSGGDSKLVAVNQNVKEDGSKRKSYKVDLGIIKISRVKNTNN